MKTRWLQILACGLCVASIGCDDTIHIVDAEFEIDTAGASDFGDVLTKDEIEDLNLTVEMTPDYIVIPTGIAIAFTTKAYYVRVPKDDRTEFIDATEWEQRANWDATDPPTDEELDIQPSGSVDVRIVNNQDESDTRARWVIWGMQQGEGSIVVSGSLTEGSHAVPVRVVFQ